MECEMSLPLPVFRLESRRDLPFEPLCAIPVGPARDQDARAGGLVERFGLWLANAERAPVRSQGLG
jgi:hypothetical protein